MNKSVFSTVTSQAPFINFTDGNRVQMASSMIRQSQTLVNPELPLILTNHSFIYAQSFSCQIAKESGIIVDKFNDVILVKYDSGEEDVFIMGDLFRSPYRIGDRFKKGDVIVHHLMYDVKNHLPLYGVNANVMFSTENSRTYEDAVVLTKSGKEKFQYLYPVKIILEFQENDIVQVANQLRPGSKISRGTLLATFRRFASSLMSVVSNEDHKLLSEYEFTVSRIFTKFTEEFINNQPEETIKFFKQFAFEDKSLHPLIRKAVKRGFSFEAPAFIIIEGLSLRYPEVGDKFANPYGNKGVVSFIIDDFNLYDDVNNIKFTPHVIHTPVGVPSRMNLGQILYMSLGYLLKYIVPQKLSEMNDVNEKLKFLIKFYAYIAPKPYVEKLVNALKNQTKEQIRKHIEEVEREGFRIVLPQFTYNMFDKVYNLYKELNVPTSFIDERTGLRMGAGVIYTMLLEHLAFKKLKHLSVGEVDSRTLQPTDGQRMGEMEMWTLASHNALNFLKESLTIRSDDIVSKDKVIMELIKNGSSNMPKKTKSSTFDLFKAYMIQMGIELHEED